MNERSGGSRRRRSSASRPLAVSRQRQRIMHHAKRASAVQVAEPHWTVWWSRFQTVRTSAAGLVVADFGQTDFGQLFDRLWPVVGLTDFGQNDFGQFFCFSVLAKFSQPTKPKPLNPEDLHPEDMNPKPGRHPSGHHPSGPPRGAPPFGVALKGVPAPLSLLEGWLGQKTKTPIWATIGLAKVGHPNVGQSRSIKVGQTRPNCLAKVGISREAAPEGENVADTSDWCSGWKPTEQSV